MTKQEVILHYLYNETKYKCSLPATEKNNTLHIRIQLSPQDHKTALHCPIQTDFKKEFPSLGGKLCWTK